MSSFNVFPFFGIEMVDQFLSRAHIIACECASDCQCNNEAEEEKIVSHGDSSRKKRQQSLTETNAFLR